MAKKATDENKYRGRVHMLLLYPDNECHVEALDKLSKSYDYAAIQHDKDTWTAEDEKKNPEHKQGEVKKAHFHVVVRTNNPTWNTALCKELGIETKFCEQARSVDNALQYLIHYNDADKATYSVDDVFGTMRTKLTESINKIEKSEGEKVVELIEFIEMYGERLSVKEFAKYCALNGYWAEFRRSGAIFCKMIEEHNQEVERSTERAKASEERLLQRQREVAQREAEKMGMTLDQYFEYEREMAEKEDRLPY